MTADELGKINYDAYCDTRDWKAFNGDPLPQWCHVAPEIKTGWIAAASAVATTIHMAAAQAATEVATSGTVTQDEQLKK